jgi:Na+/H+ antiporter NhaA
MIISLLCVVGVAMGWFIDALIEGDEKDELDVVTARFGVLVVGDS